MNAIFGSSPLGRKGYRKDCNVFIEPTHRCGPRIRRGKPEVQVRIQWGTGNSAGEANIRLSPEQALWLASQIVEELDDVFAVDAVKAAFLQVMRLQGQLYMTAHPELFKKGGE